MKGITQRLRELVNGEQIDVTGVSRENLYLISRRLKINISVSRSRDGFNVTKLCDRQTAKQISERSEPVNVETDFDFGA